MKENKPIIALLDHTAALGYCNLPNDHLIALCLSFFIDKKQGLERL